MNIGRSIYSTWYRHFRVPWDIGPREELVALVESGRIEPCKVIDLGSGTANNCIYLAEKGFDVTGVDFAPGAIELGRKRARQAGVKVNFIEADLTALHAIEGPFDLLIDYGTLDDLSPSARDSYMRNVIPLCRPGSQFLLYVFEWEPRWWERLTGIRGMFVPGEVHDRFGELFEIERYAAGESSSIMIPAWAVYWMQRNSIEFVPS